MVKSNLKIYQSICSINFNMGLVCNIWVECASFNGTAQRIQCTTLARGKVQHWPTSRIIFLHEHSLIHLQKKSRMKAHFYIYCTHFILSHESSLVISCVVYTWHGLKQQALTCKLTRKFRVQCILLVPTGAHWCPTALYKKEVWY